MRYINNLRRFTLIVAAPVVLLVTMGCGSSDGLNHRPIYGKIEGVEGRSGSITLVPEGGLQAPAATVPITDGEYHFDSTNGPVPGAYEAIIALEGASETSTEKMVEPVKDDKVVEFSNRQGRTLASFDVRLEKSRVKISVPESEPLEVNINLP